MVNVMGIYFKKFCDSQPKLLDGHVLDIIDMEESAKDLAVMAFLRDDGNHQAAFL